MIPHTHNHHLSTCNLMGSSSVFSSFRRTDTAVDSRDFGREMDPLPKPSRVTEASE